MSKTETSATKKRSKRFYALVIGGALLAVCLCLGAVMALGDDDGDATADRRTPTATHTTTPQPSATSTRTERPTWTPKPTATHKPTEAPTEPILTATMTPAACDCTHDYNCDEFASRVQAQACFDLCGAKNWSGLDSDGDGRVCETLP